MHIEFTEFHGYWWLINAIDFINKLDERFLVPDHCSCGNDRNAGQDGYNAPHTIKNSHFRFFLYAVAFPGIFFAHPAAITP